MFNKKGKVFKEKNFKDLSTELVKKKLSRTPKLISVDYCKKISSVNPQLKIDEFLKKNAWSPIKKLNFF